MYDNISTELISDSHNFINLKFKTTPINIQQYQMSEITQVLNNLLHEFESKHNNLFDKLSNVKLISGRSNIILAQKIAHYLNIELIDRKIIDFPNSEINIQINENIRHKDIFIIQTGSKDEFHSINDYIMETLIMVDACKRSGSKSITCIMPSFPYARSDKKLHSREPIVASLITELLTASGCNRIISVDLHAAQIQGFTKQPFDNLYAINLHIENLKKTILKEYFPTDNSICEDENQKLKETMNQNFSIVSLDVGGSKRVVEYSKRLGIEYSFFDKQRDYTKPGTILKTLFVGNVSLKNKRIFVIDDMIDSGSTMVAGIKILSDFQVKSAIIIVTHGLFSGEAIKNINECNLIEKVIVIDTLNVSDKMKKCNKIEVVTCADMLGETIKRIKTGESISELFAINK